MKKFDIKKWLFPLNVRSIGIISLSIGCNVLGRYLANIWNLPIWFDTVGTFLSAALLGPFAGGVCGLTSSVIIGSFDFYSSLYAYVNALVGITIGFTFPRGEKLSLYRIFATSVSATFVSVFCSLPLNIILYDGYTGNVWGDALVDMVNDRLGLKYFAALLGEGLVDYPDKMVDMFLVMSGIGVFQKITKKNFKEITVFLLAVCAGVGLFLSSTHMVLAQGVDVASDYVSSIYTTDSGLASNEMMAVTQTSDGYIWLGGNSGLYRYDGVNFKKIQSNDISSVTCLYADSSNNLWIGTNDMGVVRYGIEDKTFTSYRVANGLPSDSIRSITEGADHNIYVGNVSSLAVIRPSGIIGSFDYLEDLKYVQSVAAEDNGRVFCVTDGGLLMVLQDEKPIHRINCKDESVYYTCVSVGENGDLWVGTSSNFVEHYRFYNNEPVLVGTVSTDEVYYINNMELARDMQAIAVCGENGNGVIDDNQNFYGLSESDFNSSVKDAALDYQNNLWFVSEKQGVLKFSVNIFTIPTRRMEEQVGAVSCVYRDGKELYIGTDHGIVVEDISNSSGNIVPHPEFDSLKDNKIKHIFKDSKNNYWICLHGAYGLVEFTADGREIVYKGGADGEDADRFNMCIELHDGTIAAAGTKGIYYISNEEVTGTFMEGNGLDVTQILCLLETDDFKLLACSDGDGVYVIRDGEIIEHIDDREGLTSMVVLSAIHCGYGYIYVTSNALFYDDRDEIHKLTNFPYSNNYDAYVTEDGELWVYGSAGIYVTSVEDALEDSPDYDYTLLDHVRGLKTTLSSEGWNTYDASEDKFYFCCADGVYCLDRSDYEKGTEDYAICVDDVLVDGEPVEYSDGKYQIPAGMGKVEITPSVLNYSMNDPLIRYYVKGLSDSETTIRQSQLTSLNLGSIRHGDYEFHMELLDEQTKDVVKEEVYYLHKDSLMYEKLYFRLYTMTVGFSFIAFIVWMLSNYRNLMVIESQYEELEEAKDTADRANNAKSKFLASMSHEIRTPINAVLGMDEMILRETNDPQILEYANDIYGAGTHLLTLINQILDTSKIESGKMEIVPTDYDLGAAIHDMFNMIIHRASEADLSVVVEVDKTLPSKLHGDEMRVKQVITNMLTNAVKYTKEGGIWLRVSGSRENDTAHLHVEVEDTGIGIREEDLPTLFDVYKRLEVKKNHYVEGTGLGLSIANQFLQLMGSHLQVESTYGKGSKFFFDLDQKIVDDAPLGEDYDPTCYTDVFKEHHSGSSFIAPDARVLVVDDNTLNRQVVRSLLKASQIQVEEASGGEASVEMCKEKHYDVIFMDHMMPEMDGVEAMHLIRGFVGGPNENTPIYALTANAIAGAKETYLQEGFDGFISKPIVFAQLEDAIRESLSEDMMAPMPKELEDSMVEQGGVAPDDLPSVDGLDWNFAWLHLPNRNLLQESLTEFYTLLPVQSEKLENFYEKLKNGDGGKDEYENYRILIHSMKSLSATVGIVPLAGSAKILEFAAKDKNYNVITALHPIFIKEWNSYSEKLKGVFGIGEEEDIEKKQGNATICYKLSRIILMALYNMDIDAADMSVKKLKEFTFGEEADAYLPAVEAAVMDLDESATKRALQQMLDILKPQEMQEHE